MKTVTVTSKTIKLKFTKILRLIIDLFRIYLLILKSNIACQLKCYLA